MFYRLWAKISSYGHFYTQTQDTPLDPISHQNRMDQELITLLEAMNEINSLVGGGITGKTNLTTGAAESTKRCAVHLSCCITNPYTMFTGAVFGSIATLGIFARAATVLGEKMHGKYADFGQICEWYNNTVGIGIADACNAINATLAQCCDNNSTANNTTNCTDPALDTINNVCKLSDQESNAFAGVFGSLAVLVLTMAMCAIYRCNDDDRKTCREDVEAACIENTKIFTISDEERKQMLASLTKIKDTLNSVKVQKNVRDLTGKNDQFVAFVESSNQLTILISTLNTAGPKEINKAKMREIWNTLSNETQELIQINRRISPTVSEQDSINMKTKTYGSTSAKQ